MSETDGAVYRDWGNTRLESSRAGQVEKGGGYYYGRACIIYQSCCLPCQDGQGPAQATPGMGSDGREWKGGAKYWMD